MICNDISIDKECNNVNITIIKIYNNYDLFTFNTFTNSK